MSDLSVDNFAFVSVGNSIEIREVTRLDPRTFEVVIEVEGSLMGDTSDLTLVLIDVADMLGNIIPNGNMPVEDRAGPTIVMTELIGDTFTIFFSEPIFGTMEIEGGTVVVGERSVSITKPRPFVLDDFSMFTDATGNEVVFNPLTVSSSSSSSVPIAFYVIISIYSAIGLSFLCLLGTIHCAKYERGTFFSLFLFIFSQSFFQKRKRPSSAQETIEYLTRKTSCPVCFKFMVVAERGANCVHTVCANCSIRIEDGKCPECRKEGGFVKDPLSNHLNAMVSPPHVQAILKLLTKNKEANTRMLVKFFGCTADDVLIFISHLNQGQEFNPCIRAVVEDYWTITVNPKSIDINSVVMIPVQESERVSIMHVKSTIEATKYIMINKKLESDVIVEDSWVMNNRIEVLARAAF